MCLLGANSCKAQTVTDKTASSTLAEFATSLNYQTTPAEVAANAKLRLLDTVGVCLLPAVQIRH